MTDAVREFKFRVYDSDVEDGVMVYSDLHNSRDYSVDYLFDFGAHGLVICRWWEDYEDSCGFSQERGGEVNGQVMISTGIVDKHGIDIYENDIILAGSTDMRFSDGSTKAEYKLKPYIVKWGSYGSFYLWDGVEGHLGGMGLIECGSAEWLEVLGNIYESYEVLAEYNKKDIWVRF